MFFIQLPGMDVENTRPGPGGFLHIFFEKTVGQDPEKGAAQPHIILHYFKGGDGRFPHPVLQLVYFLGVVLYAAAFIIARINAGIIGEVVIL